MKHKTMNFRLALRVEGAFWNAYLAKPHEMTDAILIGSIALGVVKNNLEIKTAFQELMQAVLCSATNAAFGVTPTLWVVKPAPESERSGNA